jgi:hypothetical protein
MKKFLYVVVAATVGWFAVRAYDSLVETLEILSDDDTNG